MAKRFMKPTINWQEIEKRVSPEQKTKYFTFRAKSDGYLQRVRANPEEMPKLDWETYNKLIPLPNLIEKFKSELEKFKVPYPADTLTPKIDEQWKSLQTEIEKFCAEREKEIEKAAKELTRIKALPKFEDITLEMYYDLYPNEAVDPVKKPTFWPHTPEEQIGYIAPEQKALKKSSGH